MNELSPLLSLFNHRDYSRLHGYCNTSYNVRTSADVASTQSTFSRSPEWGGAGTRLLRPDCTYRPVPYRTHHTVRTVPRTPHQTKAYFRTIRLITCINGFIGASLAWLSLSLPFRVGETVDLDHDDMPRYATLSVHTYVLYEVRGPVEGSWRAMQASEGPVEGRWRAVEGYMIVG